MNWLGLIVAQANQSAAYQTGRAAGSLMGALCMFVFIAAIIAFLIFVWGTIFKKAGYSFWLALLMIVPLANLIWLLIFAFSTWPIQRELDAYRSRGGYPPQGSPVQPPRPPQ